MIVIIDAQKCSWRLARAHIRHVTQLVEKHLIKLIVIRPDAFWDKQRVENCAKTYKKGEVSKEKSHFSPDVQFHSATCYQTQLHIDSCQYLNTLGTFMSIIRFDGQYISSTSHKLSNLIETVINPNQQHLLR